MSFGARLPRLLIIVSALQGLAGTLAPVLAQNYPTWGWDSPRRYYRPAPPPPRYDNGYDDEDRYDEPRYRRRFYEDRGGDEDRYYEPRASRQGRPDRYYEQDQGGDYVEEDNKAVGVDGGPRPGIAPQAPAQIAFSANYPPGSIVIDTSARKLYFVTSTSRAFAYPIGVGRDGFSWTGSEKISRITDWPDWYPPAEMRARRPELPSRMLGGLNNPLGAKALYLGNTLYRIHGTNDPKSIGKAESSGCFRMLNANVLHLASLVEIGTPVTVVRTLGSGVAAAEPRQKRRFTVDEQSQPSRRRPAREDIDNGWNDEPWYR